MDAQALSARLAAIASPQRMRILSMLAGEALHVSELARRVQMSRALLYMHLQRLEEAGYVTGRLELSNDGKALKYFEIVPFDLTIDLATIVAAVRRSEDQQHSEEVQRSEESG
ncbi:winged helix-turn-helix transcriptional regulator [Humibacter ginsenosidimutans]|uniref:Winged helix-turn-helix transcriptional regulator n=2 Tax=Humibacter ginsenosidimutans TaxID=2599293 RepID=A0A5B8MAH7_9MICO|nr:winged helix-turn-helix transcriptional regulator [Humibacter ginsenosidimutans]